MSGSSTSFFQASRAPVAFAREKKRSGRHAQEGRRGMCSDTLNPGGEVQICCVGCILDMPEIPRFVFIVAASRYMGFLELKKCSFMRGCLGCGGILCFFATSVCVALIFERGGGASKPGPPLAARDSSSIHVTTPVEGSLLLSKLPHAADRVWRGLATYTRVRTTTPEDLCGML